jgi:hypothetical protein
MALRKKRELMVLPLLLLLAFGCGARTTLGIMVDDPSADVPTAGGDRNSEDTGAEPALGGRSSTLTTRAGAGVVATGGRDTTEDPPPICIIGERKYRNHETNPLNPCQRCLVLRSRSAWTLDSNCTNADAGS